MDQRLPQLEDRIHDLEDRVRVLEPIGLHECRHTFASLMIAAGVDAKALSAYMGHASITVALDRYGHLMPGNESEAAELIDTYLARAGGSMQLNAARDALVSASKQR